MPFPHKPPSFLAASKSERAKPWFRDEDDEMSNERAKKAYEALLMVSARVPETSEYLKFSKAVMEIAREQLGFNYKQEEVRMYIMQRIKCFLKGARIPRL